MATCSSPSEIGEALLRLGISKEDLLGSNLKPVVVTNEVVLDLFHFKNRNLDCTYHTLRQWLFLLLDHKENLSYCKSNTEQSILRLCASLTKLKNRRIHILRL